MRLVAAAILAFAAACSSSSGGNPPLDAGARDATAAAPDAGTDTGSATSDAGSTVDADGEAACPSGNAATGGVGGSSFAPQSAAAFSDFEASGSPQQVTVVVSSSTTTCAVVQSQWSTAALAPSLEELVLTLGAYSTTTGSPVALTTGTYTPQGAARQVQAVFTAYDASCSSSTALEATGQVVLCSAGPAYAGSFDLHFGASHVSGTFSAASCAVDWDAGAPADAGATCHP
jgi:hypothetical protein